jgi:plasmid stabilization system protein ParE
MVKKSKLVVTWDKPAYTTLQRIFEYIRQDSPVNADKVREEILKATRGLVDHPEKYPRDKFKKDNPGNYRAFEKYSYRVAYRHTEKEIKILRIRHVKQEPQEY